MDLNIQGDSVGGIVGGFFSSGYLKNSFTTGTIYVTSYGGGLIGISGAIDINDSYSKVNIINNSISSGSAALGGLIGASTNSKINNSYFLGSITGHPSGSSFVGGLIGVIFPSFENSFFNSYSAGNLTGGGSLGLVGDKSFTATFNLKDSFYDQTKYNVNYYSAEIGTPKTTQQMIYNYNGENTYNNWDFINTWVDDISGNLNLGYPYHK